jgi:hypothetical protein
MPDQKPDEKVRGPHYDIEIRPSLWDVFAALCYMVFLFFVLFILGPIAIHYSIVISGLVGRWWRYWGL